MLPAHVRHPSECSAFLKGQKKEEGSRTGTEGLTGSDRFVRSSERRGKDECHCTEALHSGSTRTLAYAASEGYDPRGRGDDQGGSEENPAGSPETLGGVRRGEPTPRHDPEGLRTRRARASFAVDP